MVHTVLSKERTVSTILLTALRVKLHKKVLRGTICAPNYAYLGENYPKVCSSLSCQARSSVYLKGKIQSFYQLQSRCIF